MNKQEKKMENTSVSSYPNAMRGKTILYVHGFGSSGQTGTVTRIRALLPNTTVTAPDLPIHPSEALELLARTCAAVRPAIIIGTSMGGMYAERLHGYNRILVNPAFEMGEDIRRSNMTGKVTFSNPRRDGVQEFMMTKKLQEEYSDACNGCFADTGEEEQARVWGLFGIEDTVVHTYDLFASHYRHAVRFHGKHRLNDTTLLHAVLPVIRWIDDRQEQRQPPIIYVSVEGAMRRDGKALPGVAKACHELARAYDVYFVCDAPTRDASYGATMSAWLFETVGVMSYDRLTATNRKDLLYGDYLIDGGVSGRSAAFTGTRIDIGSPTYKTWEDVMHFFRRLGGQ